MPLISVICPKLPYYHSVLFSAEGFQFPAYFIQRPTLQWLPVTLCGNPVGVCGVPVILFWLDKVALLDNICRPYSALFSMPHKPTEPPGSQIHYKFSLLYSSFLYNSCHRLKLDIFLRGTLWHTQQVRRMAHTTYTCPTRTGYPGHISTLNQPTRPKCSEPN